MSREKTVNSSKLNIIQVLELAGKDENICKGTTGFKGKGGQNICPNEEIRIETKHFKWKFLN